MIASRRSRAWGTSSAQTADSCAADLARQGDERLGGRDRAPDGLVLAHQQSFGELLLRGLDALEGRAQAAPRLADPVLERERPTRDRRRPASSRPRARPGPARLVRSTAAGAWLRRGFRSGPLPELGLVRDLRRAAVSRASASAPDLGLERREAARPEPPSSTPGPPTSSGVTGPASRVSTRSAAEAASAWSSWSCASIRSSASVGRCARISSSRASRASACAPI